MNTKNLKKSLTLIELLLASAFLIVVVAGSTALFNFAMREAVLLTRRSIALEDPAVFTLQHIQRRVFPSQGIDLVGTITNNTSTAIDVISDGSVSPSRGVRYALDAASHEIRFSPDKNNPANSRVVLARNISQFSFQNAETPAEHSNFRLLGLRITGHDYDRAEIKDFTLQTSVLARCVSPTIIAPLLVYNATQNILYSDIQTAVNAANPGEEIWLNGFNFPNNFFANDPNRDDSVFQLSTAVTVDRPLTIRGGYRFVYTGYETWQPGNPPPTPPVPSATATLNEAATQNTRHQDPRTPGYATKLDGSRLEISTINGSIDGIVFQNSSGIKFITQTATGNLTAGQLANITYCVFNRNSGIENGGRGAAPPFYTPHSLEISNCLFESGARGVMYGYRGQGPDIEQLVIHDSQFGDSGYTYIFGHSGLSSPGPGITFSGRICHIYDCNFYDLRRGGLNFQAFFPDSPIVTVLFERCLFAHTGLASELGTDIRIRDSTFTDGREINNFENSSIVCTACGTNSITVERSTFSGDYHTTYLSIYTHPLSFSHCTFEFQNGPSVLGGSMHNNVNFSYCKFINSNVFFRLWGTNNFSHCIFYNNPNGVFIIDAGSSNNFSDSIFFNNNPTDISGDVTMNFSLYQNVAGTVSGGSNIVGVNPQFVNPTTGNFQLQAGSPAIDARPTPDSAHDDRDTTPQMVFLTVELVPLPVIWASMAGRAPAGGKIFSLIWACGYDKI